MKMNLIRFFALLPATVCALAYGQAVRLESSSAAYPLSKALAEEANRAASAKVVVGDPGSSEAIRRLCAGEADLASVSRPIVKGEIARCQTAKAGFVELPVAFDGIAVIVNPRLTFLSALSVDELKKIWSVQSHGKVSRWSQINPAYPDLPLKLYGLDSRGESTNYFYEAVLGAGGEARRDITTSSDDDVIVQAVARDAHGLGYVPFTYYWANRNRLKAVAISRTAGAPAVAPSLETIAKGEYQPLSRPLFLYVSAKSLERAEVKSFAELYVQQAGRAARTLDYVPLTEDTYRVALESLRRGTSGSRWAGSVPVGLTQESLKKSLGQL